MGGKWELLSVSKRQCQLHADHSINIVGSSGVTVNVNGGGGAYGSEEKDYELEYLEWMLAALKAINNPDGGSYF